MMGTEVDSSSGWLLWLVCALRVWRVSVSAMVVLDLISTLADEVDWSERGGE